MANVLQMTSSHIVSGEFDSRKRYLRSGNVSADFPIAKGKTFYIEANSTSGVITGWSYNVNSFSKQFNYVGTRPTTSVTLVKT